MVWLLWIGTHIGAQVRDYRLIHMNTMIHCTRLYMYALRQYNSVACGRHLVVLTMYDLVWLAGHDIITLVSVGIVGDMYGYGTTEWPRVVHIYLWLYNFTPSVGENGTVEANHPQHPQQCVAKASDMGQKEGFCYCSAMTEFYSKCDWLFHERSTSQTLHLGNCQSALLVCTTTLEN